MRKPSPETLAELALYARGIGGVLEGHHEGRSTPAITYIGLSDCCCLWMLRADLRPDRIVGWPDPVVQCLELLRACVNDICADKEAFINGPHLHTAAEFLKTQAALLADLSTFHPTLMQKRIVRALESRALDGLGMTAEDMVSDGIAGSKETLYYGGKKAQGANQGLMQLRELGIVAYSRSHRNYLPDFPPA